MILLFKIPCRTKGLVSGAQPFTRRPNERSFRIPWDLIVLLNNCAAVVRSPSICPECRSSRH